MKIGIAGSGMIVRTCLETFAEMEGTSCCAICARPESLPRARALADEFAVPRVYDDYDALLEDRDADFIYIGVANHVHFDYARRALLAGKDVILEKPFTTDLPTTEELIRLAEKNNCFLFEAITSIHLPLFRLLRDSLHKLGDIRLVQANYSQFSSRYERYLAGEVFPSFDPACFGGALYDLNVYNLHIAAALFGVPQKARYLPNLGHNGVDVSGMVTMTYDGFQVVCSAAKDSASPCHFTVQGTKGYARILGAPNACPSLEIAVGGETKTVHDPRSHLRLAPEFEAFEAIRRQGDQDACRSLLQHTANVLSILDAVSIYHTQGEKT